MKQTSLILAGALALAACRGKTTETNDRTYAPSPIETVTEKTPVDVKPIVIASGKNAAKATDDLNVKLAAGNASAATRSVTAEVTAEKKTLFETEYLYGFDLQYSSQVDPKYDLLVQSQALGHVPAFFQRVGNKIQLTADQRRLFESDVNHPDVMINEYEIVREDDTTVTFKLSQAGQLLNQLFNGAGTAAPAMSWLRSAQYVADGGYLLQETALMQPNGNVQTYLESLMPRKTLVPEGYQGLKADTSVEPLAERYRFLAAEPVYVNSKDANGRTVRVKTKFASRFNLDNGKTLDWYVTRNIPDEFLPEIKSGIEGWNRYFKPQLGRDIMVFKGKMPADMKLGDPRYNIVNWDSVAQAGAAYETQAADPLTGLQSHAMVYMPFAWYNIGSNLWTNRIDETSNQSQVQASLNAKSPDVLFGGKVGVRCAMPMALPSGTNAQYNAFFEFSNELPKTTDEFARRIVVSTLFHEIGHALGLDHNFKGSLSFDGEKPASATNPTTWSVMDYNYYQHEMGLFEKLGESAGPALEYDRQIISALYNKAKDVKETDAVLPACNDEEADATDGGLDPLCQRYDAEKNPIQAAVHAYNNFTAATGAKGIETKTLAEAISGKKDALEKRFADAAAVPTADAAKKLGGDVAKITAELIKFYTAEGAQSLRVNMAKNSIALRTWSDSVKDASDQDRKDYLKALQATLALSALPAPVQAAIADLGTAIKKGLAANTALSTQEQNAAADEALKTLQAKADEALQTNLARVRTSVIGNLAYNPSSPYALIRTEQGQEYERVALGVLASSVTFGIKDHTSRSKSDQAERVAAATALKAFGTVGDVFGDSLDAVKSELKAIEKAATDKGYQKDRNDARALLVLLAK